MNLPQKGFITFLSTVMVKSPIVATDLSSFENSKDGGYLLLFPIPSTKLLKISSTLSTYATFSIHSSTAILNVSLLNLKR